jgi:hypothetical protein
MGRTAYLVAGAGFARPGYQRPVTRRDGEQGRRDSNPRPTVLETAALPTELRPWVRGRL